MDNFNSYNIALQEAFNNKESLYEKNQSIIDKKKENLNEIKDPLDVVGGEMIREATMKALGGGIKAYGQATGNVSLVNAGDRLATGGIKKAISGAMSDAKTLATKKAQQLLEDAKGKLPKQLKGANEGGEGGGESAGGDSDGIFQGLQDKATSALNDLKTTALQGKSITTGQDLSLKDITKGYLTKGGKGSASKARQVKGEDEAGGAEDDFEDLEPIKFTPKPPAPNLTEEQKGVQDSLDSGKAVETDPFKTTPTPAQKPPAPPEEELPTEAEIEDSNPDLVSDSKVLEDAKPSLPPINKTIPKPEENPFQFKAPTQEEAFSELGGTSEEALPTMTTEQAQSLVQSFSAPKFDPTAPVEGEFTGTGGSYTGAGGQTIKQGETPAKGAGAEPEIKAPDSLPSLDELNEAQEAKTTAPLQEETPLEEESIPKLGQVGNPLLSGQAPPPPPPAPAGGAEEEEEEEFEGFGKEEEEEEEEEEEFEGFGKGDSSGSGSLTATKGDVDSSINSGGIDMTDKAPFPAGRPPPPDGKMYNEAGDLVDAEEDGLSTALAGSLAGDFNPVGFLITAGLGLATVFSPLFHKKFTANAGNPLNPSAQFGAT